MSERSGIAAELLERSAIALRDGRPRPGVDLLKAAIATDPSQAVAQRASELLAEVDPETVGLTTVKVALLSDHNVGPTPRLLRARALLSGLFIEAFVPEFDTWMQEVADPESATYAFAPDVVVLSLRLGRLAPALEQGFLSLNASEVEAGAARVEDSIAQALDAMRRHGRVRVLIDSFPRPERPVLGIYDRLAGPGHVETIERLNGRIRALAAVREDVYVVDLDQLVSEVGTAAFFDPRMFALAKVRYSGRGLSRLAAEYAKYLRAFYGRTKKVLVLDGDNTLWGGIVGEDGLDGIQLDGDGPAGGYLDLQRYVAELGRKGVVLALNTSNERADVIDVLTKRPEMILREDDFAIIVANWKDKAENLVEIAKTLDLAVDSFVFVDDDPLQCARIRTALPDVAVVELSGNPFDHANTLARAGWFDGLALTDEDRRRNTLYRADVSRQMLEQVAASKEDFTASLQVRLLFAKLAPGGIARAASLTQRTNQFNLTTRRYTEADLRSMLADPSWSGFTVRLVDRFGDIGVVGFALIRCEGSRATIDTLLLSCRALRRHVEDAMLSVAVQQALEAGASEVVGIYVPTPRNGQTERFYADRGFEPLPDGAGRSWRRTDPLALPEHVSIEYVGDGWR